MKTDFSKVRLGLAAAAALAVGAMATNTAQAGVTLLSQTRSIGGAVDLSFNPGDHNAFDDVRTSTLAGAFNDSYVAEASASAPPRTLQGASNGSLSSNLSSSGFSFSGELSTIGLAALRSASVSHTTYDLNVTAFATANVKFHLDGPQYISSSVTGEGDLPNMNVAAPASPAAGSRYLTREYVFSIFKDGQEVLDLLGGTSQTRLLSAGNYELRLANGFGTHVNDGSLNGAASSQSFGDNSLGFNWSVGFEPAGSSSSTPPAAVPLPPAALAGLVTMGGGWCAARARRFVKA